MAAVPITITGVLFDKHARTTQLVTLMGEASITGLGVGGGPIYPPPVDPNAPHPEHPIVPPGGYPEGPGFGLKPSHPIALPGDPWWPKPPELPPSDPNVIKPPPPEGGWGWIEPYGWGYFPGASGAGPKT